MSSFLPQEHLRAIERTSERHEGRDGFVCLDRNERITPIPDVVLKEMLASIASRDITGYPDAGPFVSRLAAATGLREDQLAETAGSDAALRRIYMAYLKPGRTVVFPNPSYAMYAIYTRIFEGVARPVDYEADRAFNLDRFLAAITPEVDIVVVANPDQPLGTALSPDALHRIIARAGQVGAICVIDEAYHPFHPETVLPLVPQLAQLIVTRTFSKFPGVAGLRLGYAAGTAALIKGLMAVRGGNEVSGVSLALGCYLLDHPEIGKGFHAAAEQGRVILVAGARELGFETPLCRANFQLLACPPDVNAVDVARALERRGFLVKSGFGHAALTRCLRVTLNDPDIMAQFIVALGDALREVAATNSSQSKNAAAATAANLTRFSA